MIKGKPAGLVVVRQMMDALHARSMRLPPFPPPMHTLHSAQRMRQHAMELAEEMLARAGLELAEHGAPSGTDAHDNSVWAQRDRAEEKAWLDEYGGAYI